MTSVETAWPRPASTPYRNAGAPRSKAPMSDARPTNSSLKFGTATPESTPGAAESSQNFLSRCRHRTANPRRVEFERPCSRLHLTIVEVVIEAVASMRPGDEDAGPGVPLAHLLDIAPRRHVLQMILRARQQQPGLRPAPHVVRRPRRRLQGCIVEEIHLSPGGTVRRIRLP